MNVLLKKSCASVWFSVLLLSLLTVFTIATSITPLAIHSQGRWFSPPCDFSLRMAEVDCLRRGVDPFLVWRGDVVLPPFRPNFGAQVRGPEFTVDINAYVPWVYTVMLPFSYLPRAISWAIYFTLMIASWWAIAVCFIRACRKTLGMFPAVGALVFSFYPYWSNVCIGNFSIFVLAALVLMAYFLNKGHDVLAGCCWAVVMLKPQLGIIFAIPLLMRKKWITCLVAGGICLALSIPPSLMCGVSPVTMILQSPSANTFMFHGCGTWPYALCGSFGGQYDILVALSVGAAVCWWMTRLVSCRGDWLVYLMPAAVCGMSWTYASSYGHVLAWFFFYVLLKEFQSPPPSRYLRTLLIVSAFSVTRIYLLYRGFASAFPDSPLSFPISDNLHWNLDSLNSSMDLVLGMLLCIFIRRKAFHGLEA